MGKSLGNFITLPQLFTGNHPVLQQAYSPMTVRFFILQAHYRGTLDFSNEALQAAEKGLKRVLQAAKDLRSLAKANGVVSSSVGTRGHAPYLMEYGEFLTSVAPEEGSLQSDNKEIAEIAEKTYQALCDDLNTPVALSCIFDAVRIINSAKDRKLNLSKSDYQTLVDLFDNVVYGILALAEEEGEGGKAANTIDGLMQMIIQQRKAAKQAKDWTTSDRIRDELLSLGIRIKDTKDGTEWTME